MCSKSALRRGEEDLTVAKSQGQQICTANGIAYCMKDFLSQCVDRYCELAKIKRETLKKADTPFRDEPKLDQEWASSQIEKAKETGVTLMWRKVHKT